MVVEWHAVARREDIPAGRGWPVRVGGRALALFAVGDEVYAVDNRCLHNGNPIDDGPVADGIVTCPWHGWCYDLATGDQLVTSGRVWPEQPGAGDGRLETYPAKVEQGHVLVVVDE